MSIISGVSGPWWGVRGCCAVEVACDCLLHHNPYATDIYDACVLGAQLTIPPFDIDAIMATSTPEHPCLAERYWNLDFWRGTYALGAANKQLGADYCQFYWYKSQQPGPYNNRIFLSVRSTGIVEVWADNFEAWDDNSIVWRRQVFTGPPPWNFFSVGEVSIPFLVFIPLLIGYRDNCDWSQVQDVTVKFVDARGNNPWAP